MSEFILDVVGPGVDRVGNSIRERLEDFLLAKTKLDRKRASTNFVHLRFEPRTLEERQITVANAL